ncbi:asparaginase [Thermoanaerobacterium thermosulfurigenes]|uniref:asparaginase n=1 Tax=Thermoanaerobacterium thermosulfurigenes TaxID=33950 RepID=UPI003F4A2402
MKSLSKKVAIVFTGGTIAMAMNKDKNSFVPALTGYEIMKLFNNHFDDVEIEIVDFGNYPSPHITIDLLKKLKSVILSLLNRSDICGVIVTHGTDTLEESAYFLDLTLDSSKPVILTGSMRNISEDEYDGINNIKASIRVAINEKSIGKGVLVVFNNKIFAASEVVKISTSSLDAFCSPMLGPIGFVDTDKVIFYRNIIPQKKILTDAVEEKVSLLKTVIGMDDKLIKFCVDSGDKGIVIEGTGRGNVTPTMVEGIKYAVANNVIVVIVSRCLTGRVLDTYGYKGGGKELVSIGAILGENLNGLKARIKLMLSLGYSNNYEEIKRMFQSAY